MKNYLACQSSLAISIVLLHVDWTITSLLSAGRDTCIVSLEIGSNEDIHDHQFTDLQLLSMLLKTQYIVAGDGNGLLE